MNAVFADAGYWIALFNPRDRLHDVLMCPKLYNTDSLLQPVSVNGIPQLLRPVG